MRLFLLEKNKVVPNPGALLINEFKSIYVRDKSKDKELALKELGFVYFLADYKSVYLSIPPEEREQVIIEDIFEDNYWKPDKEVLLAVRKYQELQSTLSMRFLQSQRHALEELMKYFSNIDFKKIIKPAELSKSMSDTSKIIESLDKIEERVKKELSVKGKTQGDREVGMFEDPD